MYLKNFDSFEVRACLSVTFGTLINLEHNIGVSVKETSSDTAIANAVRLAARGVERDVVGALAARLPQPAQAV